MSKKKPAEERAYVNNEGEIQVFVKGAQPEGWKLVPKTLYVRWAIDQADNHLLFGPEAIRADYQFDSSGDLALTREYSDQLVEHLF